MLKEPNEALGKAGETDFANIAEILHSSFAAANSAAKIDGEIRTPSCLPSTREHGNRHEEISFAVSRTAKTGRRLHHDAYSVEEFCDRHSISRAYLYLLWRRGEGPRFMKLGTRTLISSEAATVWRRRIEAETIQTA